MKKMIAVASIVVAGVSIGGTAFAGEIGGNGEPTPIATRRVAASICAFNGLDDGSEGGPVGPGNVQSFGPIVAGMAQAAGGAGSFAHMIRAEGPGTNCRGN